MVELYEPFMTRSRYINLKCMLLCKKQLILINLIVGYTKLSSVRVCFITID